MQVIIAESSIEVASLGASHVIQQIQTNPNSVLGLATGSTPIAMYKELIRRYEEGLVSFETIRTFNLDEYIGISPEHPQSYRYFMNTQLFKHIDIHLENTHVPDGMRAPAESALRYEADIETAGGIDLQILGIGRNGHIGFNEPSSSLASLTRIKTLSSETIRDNSRFFSKDEFQPTLALTMGIGTILNTRKVLLLATGENKAEAVRSMVEGPLAAICPASSLQMHPNAVIIVDQAAGAHLEHKEYYQKVRTETELLTAIR